MAEAEQALRTDADASPDGPRTRRLRRLIEIIPSQLETLRAHHRAVRETADIEGIAVRLGLDTPAVDGPPDPGRADDQSPIQSSVAAIGAPTMAIDEGKVAAYSADRLDQRLAEFQALVAQAHPTNDPA